MEPYQLTATESARLFRAGELSPVELLDSVVERTRQVEGVVNAVTEELLDTAYEAARRSESVFAAGREAGALEGIPLMLKEEQPIAGHLAEDGCVLERGRVAEVTHPIVNRITAAGAVVHGRTSTPEYCCSPVTHSKLWGVTRNPWNAEFTPGGSSGGAGAVLAAGETVLATGSDIGGSIRIPSAFCGVVGFKPPFGRVPGLPPFNSDTYCADGPMGRSVADVALLQNVIAGPSADDHASLRPAMQVGANQDAAGLRVALCLTLGDYDVDPAIVQNTYAAADALRSAGVKVDEVELPWTRTQILAAAWAHFGAIMGPFIEQIFAEGPDRADQMMPYTLAFARTASQGEAFVEGLLQENAIARPLGALLEQYDAMICPTIATTGFRADDPATDTTEIFGQLMTLPFNVVGRVPVLAVPSGLAPNGVPTGVQIVGRTYDDDTAFRVGFALEQSLGLWTSPAWWPMIQTGASA
jgi:Asp-tRNA(Asn)/Glu-tRNA(Gln) amidotransferase A subunit family amidase